MVWSDIESSTAIAAIIALSLPALKGLVCGLKSKRKASSARGCNGNLKEEDHELNNLTPFRSGGVSSHPGYQRLDVGVYQGEQDVRNSISSGVIARYITSDEIRGTGRDNWYNRTISSIVYPSRK